MLEVLDAQGAQRVLRVSRSELLVIVGNKLSGITYVYVQFCRNASVITRQVVDFRKNLV